MKLNEDKCHLLISGNKFQHHFLSIKQCKIRESQSEKLLGIDIDRNLDFINYVNTVCIKANSKLSALARISKYLSLEKRKVLFKSFFESQFTYCPLVWMFHDRKMNNKINKLHERALRLVYSDDKSSFQELLDIDNSVTIHNRNLRVLALEIFKFIHGLLPSIMENIFLSKPIDRRALRSQQDLYLPNVKSVHKGQDSLRYFGPIVWSMYHIMFRMI